MKTARYVVPFSTAALVFAAMLLLLLRHGLHADGGVFVYPLDDAYIHLAVSRNLTLHGVWGISPQRFSGASSSPAWTLLLATVIRFAGVHVTTPLVLNALAALLLLAAAAYTLARRLPQAGLGLLTLALLAMVFTVPLPGLAMIGMEHVLHAFAMLVMVAAAAWLASVPSGESAPRPALLVLGLGALASGSLRYESCFGVLVVAVVLLSRRGLWVALVAPLCAAVGPLLYGLYSHRHSGLYLPFSVLMKSSGRGTHNSLDSLFTASVAPILLLLAVAFLLRMAQLRLRGEAMWIYGQSFLAIVRFTTLLHAVFGPTGWLMRYEASLYALGIVALALAVGEGTAGIEPGSLSPAQRWASAAIAVSLLPSCYALLQRAHHGWSDIAVSIHDRYVEHLPQALFVEQAMPHAAVIANDIGFLAFYADDIQILDPLGLGSIEPVELTRHHEKVSPQFMHQWGAQQHAQLAILHTDFPGMDSMVPQGWVLVDDM